MPRNSAKKDETPLEVRFARLDATNVLIFHHYYQFLDTDGEKGFDPKNAGSIKHKRYCTPSFGHLTENAFRTRGKTMATLARKYYETGKEVYRMKQECQNIHL
jgi:hypothetical protein